MSLDEQRGIVYVATANPVNMFIGRDRLGDNLFGNTLLALDANTGKRIWHFQTVKHDIWDRDLPSPPSLITVRRDGKNVDAVSITTKTGHVFVFDRVNGTPLFPIEYKKYPASTIRWRSRGGDATAAHQARAVRQAAADRRHGDQAHSAGTRVRRWRSSRR